VFFSCSCCAWYNVLITLRVSHVCVCIICNNKLWVVFSLLKYFFLYSELASFETLFRLWQFYHDISVTIVMLIFIAYDRSILAFSALSLFVGRQKEHLTFVKIEWWVLVWFGPIYLEWGTDCLHMVQLMPLPSRKLIMSCLI